jgi:molecular chaperone IbpA
MENIMSKSKLPAIFADSLNALEKLVGDMNTTYLDFDRVFERFDRAFPVSIRTVTFPPVDLLKVEGGYLVQLAVAGYGKDELTVEVSNDNILTVSGDQAKDADASQYLFKGISARSFIRKWQLLETDSVESVKLKDGMMTIKIARAASPEPTSTRIPVDAA